MIRPGNLTFCSVRRLIVVRSSASSHNISRLLLPSFGHLSVSGKKCGNRAIWWLRLLSWLWSSRLVFVVLLEYLVDWMCCVVSSTKWENHSLERSVVECWTQRALVFYTNCSFSVEWKFCARKRSREKHKPLQSKRWSSQDFLWMWYFEIFKKVMVKVFSIASYLSYY